MIFDKNTQQLIRRPAMRAGCVQLSHGRGLSRRNRHDAPERRRRGPNRVKTRHCAEADAFAFVADNSRNRVMAGKVAERKSSILWLQGADLFTKY
jgi:hypothetical protein